jgi:serine/threonine-protein kinase
MERAAELDPRSVTVLGDLCLAYGAIGSYTEAERCYDRIISLAPDRAAGYAFKALGYVVRQGRTEKTPELLREALERVDAAELMSWFAFLHQRVLFRVDDAYQRVLDGLSARSFESDSATYFLAKAVSYGQRDQPAVEHAYYDSARVVLEAEVQRRPGDASFHGRLGLAYAGLGRKEDAIGQGERAVELLPVARDAASGPMHVQNLAEIYTMVGEYDAAMDEIEYLLTIPSFMSAPLLRVDPLYDPLRDNPRFQALLEKYEN